ncbi:MAG: M23 family metallopeptidase [Spirochaetaceae bacterium]|nr:M23 family metallopeptidase [Spirochaetaceae bacterium]
MKITVKEFVKLDIQGLMQINGGTSACGNYSKTQPATPPSGGNETNNAPSNNGSDTPSSYSPSYSNGSTTGTSTGTCGGSGEQNKNPSGDNPSNDKPNNDTTNNNNNNNTGGSTSVGGCSSINGGNGNGDELKGKEEDDLPANDLPENTTPAPEQPTTPTEPSTPPSNPSGENASDYHPEDWIVESEKGISFPLGDGCITDENGDVKYPMTSDYGMRDPIPEVDINDENFHNGIDFAAKEGERINSVADGYISYVGIGKQLGNYVIVNHENGTRTLYAHCSDINVSVGDIVDGGQMIASVGQTGAATGPHLHFAFDANGNGDFYEQGIDNPNLLFNF